LRRAGRPDPVAEVYNRIIRRSFEAVACFKAAPPPPVEEPEETPRERADYVVTRWDWIHGAYCRSRVTEAHHAAEEMRLPKASAKTDAGKPPGGLVCSARLP
jgi:hypothetical protein